MCRKFLFFCLVAIIFCNLCYAQKDTLTKDSLKSTVIVETSKCAIWPDKDYFKSYFTDARDVIKSPFSCDKNDRKLFIVGLAATGVALTFDKKIISWIQGGRTPFVDKFSQYAFEPWGGGEYSIGLLALLYTHGVVFKNNRNKTSALLGMKAFAVSGAVVTIPKLLFGRHRPFQNDGTPDPYDWDGPGFNYKSFMSGHTTVSFAMATIIAYQYKEYKALPYIVYTAAGLTGLSRINDYKHWPSDVVAGGFLGYAIGRLICKHKNWKVTVSPSAYTDFPTISCIIPLGGEK